MFEYSSHASVVDRPHLYTNIVLTSCACKSFIKYRERAGILRRVVVIEGPTKRVENFCSEHWTDLVRTDLFKKKKWPGHFHFSLSSDVVTNDIIKKAFHPPTQTF